MTKSDLMRKMHRAGLRLDDAALAAQVAVKAVRRFRDRVAIRATKSGLSLRVVGAVVGLSFVRVWQVLNAARSDLTPTKNTMSEVVKEMRDAGLNVADALLAAQVTMSVMASSRESIVCKIHQRLPVRQVAAIVGLSKTHVARLSHNTDSDGTGRAPNLHATADG